MLDDGEGAWTIIYLFIIFKIVGTKFSVPTMIEFKIESSR